MATQATAALLHVWDGPRFNAKERLLQSCLAFLWKAKKDGSTQKEMDATCMHVRKEQRRNQHVRGMVNSDQNISQPVVIPAATGGSERGELRTCVGVANETERMQRPDREEKRRGKGGGRNGKYMRWVGVEDGNLMERVKYKP